MLTLLKIKNIALSDELIAIEVIRALFCQIEKIVHTVSSVQTEIYTQTFLNSLLDNSLGKISFSSWMHGLNTSLGQSFFEHTAYILSNGQKIKFSGNLIGESQKQAITAIVTELQNNREATPNLQKEDEMIFLLAEEDAEIEAHDFTVDIFWEDDREVVAIESKTVRPNNDISKITKVKMLEAKVVLKKLYPNKDVKFFYGFPFDPYSLSPTGYDKKNFMSKNVSFVKYFAEDEVLIASEFWDYLSGTTQTMETILGIINSIATVEFLDEFKFLQNRKNAVNQKLKYINLLEKWHLFREKQLVENQDEVFFKIRVDNDLIKIFNQTIFNTSGEYKETRIHRLRNYE